MTTSYPLAWPDGWPRTPGHDRIDGKHLFRRPVKGAPPGSPLTKPWTFAQARDALILELTRFGVPSWMIVISSNFDRFDRSGNVIDKGPRPADQGVAVYFTRGQRRLVMASDRFIHAEENMRSLALAIDAMRQLERHGGGVMMERAFQGFAALPPPSEAAPNAAPRPWSQVLGVAPNAPREVVEAAYRALAKRAHPDTGGSVAAMAELNAARDAALRERA